MAHVVKGRTTVEFKTEHKNAAWCTLTSTSATAASVVWTAGVTHTYGIGSYFKLGAQANTAGSGLKLTSSTTSAMHVYADDGGVLLGETAVRAIRGRTLVTLSHSAETSIFGIQGQLKIQADADVTLTTGNRAGSWNYLEAAVASTKTLTLSGAYKFTAASFHMVEVSGAGTCVINTNHVLCAVAALSNTSVSTLTQTGKYAAFATVNNATGTYTNFTYMLYCGNCDNVLYFPAASDFEHGAKIADGVAGDTGSEGTVGFDALIRCYIGDVAYYIPMFDAGSVTAE